MTPVFFRLISLCVSIDCSVECNPLWSPIWFLSLFAVHVLCAIFDFSCLCFFYHVCVRITSVADSFFTVFLHLLHFDFPFCRNCLLQRLHQHLSSAAFKRRPLSKICKVMLSGFKCVCLCVYACAHICICWKDRGAKPSMYSTVTEHDDSVEFPLR